MSLKNYLSLFFILSSFQIIAQTPPVIEWEQTYGGTAVDIPEAMEATADGGIIAVGTSNSIDGHISQNNGNYDAWIIKLDALGNIVWEQTFGGSLDDRADDVRQTNDGGFIITGATFSNDGDVAQNHGGQDVWVIKLDANGNLLWEQTYGGNGTDKAYAIQQTNDDGFIITGYTNSTSGDVNPNPNGGNLWVFKLDVNGALLWENIYGGSGDEKAYGIKQTTDGGYIVGGYTGSADGDVTQNQGGKDVWVLKLDAAGTIVWQNTFGGSKDDYISFSSFLSVGNECVEQTTDGGYILVGTTFSNDGDVNQNSGIANIWIIKLKANGALDWQQTYGQIYNEGSSIIQTLDGNYIVAGTYSGVNNTNGGNDLWVFKIDNAGAIIWNDFYGGVGNDGAMDLQQISDCEFIVAGIAHSDGGDIHEDQDGTGYADYWILKLKIQVDPPTATSPQAFCALANPTLGDITVSGQNLAWYDNNGNPLAPTTSLQDGLTYHVSQTIDGCESALAPVTVIVDDGGSPMVTASAQSPVCFYSSVTYTTEPQPNTYSWQVSGGTITAGGGSSDAFASILWDGLQNTSFTLSYDTACGPVSLVYNETVAVCGDMAIEKTVSDTEPEIGQEVTFTITVANSQENGFKNVEIQEEIPSGYQLMGHTASSGSYDPLLGKWEIPSFPPNATATLTLTVTVLPEGGYLNTASIVSSNLLDADNANNSASASVAPIRSLMIPQGFSPNADGINDTFEISGLYDSFPNFELTIFSRYGNMVYEGDDSIPAWDGTSNHGLTSRGNQLPTATYYYVLDLHDPEYKVFTGWVYLNR